MRSDYNSSMYELRHGISFEVEQLSISTFGLVLRVCRVLFLISDVTLLVEHTI
jgi:hypothetical protein